MSSRKRRSDRTGYNKGNKVVKINRQGGAGWIGDDAIKDANRGVSEKLRNPRTY